MGTWKTLNIFHLFFKLFFDWLIDSFLQMELIILTPWDVDFTTIPVTESCASQSLEYIFW